MILFPGEELNTDMCRLGPLIALATFFSLSTVAGILALDEQSERSFLKLTGENYTYSIPKKYLQESTSILYPGKINGDKNLSTYLEISNLTIPGGGEIFTMQLLFFHDKIYDRSTWISSADFYRGSYEDVGKWGMFHRYRKIESGGVEDVYFSYDPVGSKPEDLKETDFRVRIQISKPISIGNITTKPKPACEFLDVYDGIFITVDVIGEACMQKNIPALNSKYRKLLESWKLN